MNPVKTFEGNLNASGKRFGIAVSRFNELITSRLLSGALDCLRRHGAAEKDLAVAWVPGSYELPQVVDRLARSGGYDAVIALGAVIHGATSHAEYINATVSRSLMDIARSSGTPVVYGVITTETLEQAIERAGTKLGNRGWQAAESAIEMAGLFASLGG